jgi:hypothetical protein
VPPRLAFAALFVAGVLVSGITALHGVQPNDEGLMLQAAERIAGGQVPYSDFWWFYPPGQPYLLAGLRELFGESLLPWRVVRVLADAGVAVLAYALARRAAGSRASLLAWAVAILAMAYPSGPHPFPIALALCLGALLAFEERPVLAGVLVGAAAAWRIEFALFAAAGIVAAALVGRPAAASGRPRAGAFALAAAAAAAVLYAPVVLMAGLRPSWELLVDYPLTDFRDYQTLPFPLAYDGPLNTSSPGGFFTDSVEPLLLFYLPLALLIGLAGAGVALVRGLSARVLATGVFALGAVAYLLVRTDLFHTAPLAVTVAILGAWALDARVLRRIPAALAGLALLYAVAEGLDRRLLVLREDTVKLDLPVADGVRVPPRQAAELEGVVARLAPGPIYVATRRSDLVTSGIPLLYALAQRANPTRYDIPAPGVVTSAPVQRELVRDLERARPRSVVRWTDPITAAPEDNAAGRSSGVTVLDDYLARAYRPAGRVGSFLLLERRAP